MRKILMMSSVWNVTCINELMRGIQERIQDEDIVLHIFNAYDIIGETEYSNLERLIFDIPNPEDYDGMLISINSIGSTPYFNTLIKSMYERNPKMLSIDHEFFDIPHIGIDNYSILYEMVEHLVVHHNCKTFNYLGGPENNEENQLRYKAFCDCLNKYGIPIEPARVKHMNFLHDDGKEAYKSWKSENLHLPDAVICANDFMALGYLVSAKADGYLPPKDFKITGFDNVAEGQLFSPTLSTVDRNWKQLGYDSISRLLDIIDGTADDTKEYFTPGLCLYNESCGCTENIKDTSVSLREAYDEKKEIQRLDIVHSITQRILTNTDIGPDYPKCLETCRETMELSALAVRLDPSSSAVSDSEIIYSNKSDGNSVIYTHLGEEQLDGILPASWIGDPAKKILFFAPLHFSLDKLGYFVVPYFDSLLTVDRHRKFQDNLALTLSISLQRKRLHNMNEKLQTLYVTDQLTGLYNRFGYEGLAKKYFDEQNGRIYLMFLDVDRLKIYNDKYGHATGDLVISGMAEALSAVLKDAPIKVRMGGDEFLAIGPYYSENELIRLSGELDRWIADYSERKNIPFPMTVSIGYVTNESPDTPLEHLVQEADNLMYEQKKARKARLAAESQSEK